MKIFTPCWGKKHIDLLKRCLSVSLSWPKNRAAVRGAEWVLVCETDEECREASEIAKQITSTFSFKFYRGPGLSAPGVDYGISLMSPLKEIVRQCIDGDEPLLMATPDFIFGEGTIDCFKAMSKDPGSCVAISHMRVLPEILNEIGPPIANSKLMSLGFKYPHVTFTDCENVAVPGRRYKAGVSWTKIKSPSITDQSQVCAIQHFMPSPFFVRFLEKDLVCFNTEHDGMRAAFGMWDHNWPSELIEDGRLRYIGSSDAAMLLEVTDPNMNVPPLNDPADPDGFFLDHFHNKIQKQFISVFRGD